MGTYAEDCSSKYNFTREQQDAFAIESVKRAQAATADVPSLGKLHQSPSKFAQAIS